MLINISTVRGNPDPDLVDRGPSYSGFTPLTVVTGGTNISIWCGIQWWSLGPSGDFNVSFRASENIQISTIDFEIAKVLVPSISGGAYADVSWTGTFPNAIPNNTYYIGWLIDVDNDVGEDVPGEANNAVYETSYQLEVVKPSGSSSIPGYNLYFLLGAFSIISIISAKIHYIKKSKFKQK